MIPLPIDSTMLTIGSTVIGATLAVFMVIAVVRAEGTFSYGAIGAGRLSLWLVNVYLITVAMNILGITVPRVHWLGYIVPGVLIVFSLMAADGIALGIAGAAQGRYRSPRYRQFLRPANEVVEQRLMQQKRQLIMNVREGHVDPKTLKGAYLLWWQQFAREHNVRQRSPARLIRRRPPERKVRRRR